MRAGHIIYKVNDLDKAVEEWKSRGFEIEYGTSDNPYNALIYFSEGPYIEILAKAGTPKIGDEVLNLEGLRDVEKRFNYYEAAKEGWIGFCIEKDPGTLMEEIKYFENKGIDGIYADNAKRIDPEGRELKFKLFFPNEFNLPFLMSDFELNPRKENFIHPNGVRSIAKLSFKTKKECINILKDLVDDSRLEIIETEDDYEISNIILEMENGNLKNIEEI
ncbi:MAG: VOC family protein [Andreesenia angusta]|nr:VOC family protein [Andreesenia angusta]